MSAESTPPTILNSHPEQDNPEKYDSTACLNLAAALRRPSGAPMGTNMNECHMGENMAVIWYHMAKMQAMDLLALKTQPRAHLVCEFAGPVGGGQCRRGHRAPHIRADSPDATGWVPGTTHSLLIVGLAVGCGMRMSKRPAPHVCCGRGGTGREMRFSNVVNGGM